MVVGAVSQSRSTLAALASVYRYYRFNRVVIHPIAGSIKAEVGMAFSSPNSTAPTTIGELEGEFVHFFTTNIYNYPLDAVERLVLPGSVLQINHPWLVTENDATEESADVCGYLYFVNQSLTTQTLSLMITIDYQFKFPLDSAIVGAFARANRLRLSSTHSDAKSRSPN